MNKTENLASTYHLASTAYEAHQRALGFPPAEDYHNLPENEQQAWRAVVDELIHEFGLMEKP